MIEKYVERTDDLTSDKSTHAKQLKKIDELVDEVKVEKDDKKGMKEKVIELEKLYAEKKAETKLILE